MVGFEQKFAKVEKKYGWLPNDPLRTLRSSVFSLEVVLTAIRVIRVIRGSSYLFTQISAPLPDNAFPFQTPILKVDE